MQPALSSSQASSNSSQPPPPPGQQKGPTILTPELIQSYLDQNQLFISAIVENQSMGKLAAAMEYQIKLQQNLLFLSSLADQPQQQPPQQQQQQSATAHHQHSSTK